MYSPFRLAVKYINYYFRAFNGKGHGMHSPFVYAFITEVMNDDRNFYAYNAIEKIRKEMLLDQREITIQDFGAGSRVKKTNTRKVSDIASSSLKPKKFSQLLFRIADHYQPKTILELGTSLGITTAYFASAAKDSRVITMEGAAEIAAIAADNIKTLQLKNVSIIEGNFDQTLSQAIEQAGTIDLAFIDGNHRYEPTVRYFHQLLPAITDQSILVFDDIHWSEEMEKAWKEIQQHPDVTVTIDLFFIGIVLFRKESKSKQDFTIRF